MFTHCTALGRKVKIEDWLSFHRDRLLHVLYTLRDTGIDDGLTLDQVRDMTGLTDTARVWDLIVMMKERNLVEVSVNNTTVITERGIRWVEESPHPP